MEHDGFAFDAVTAYGERALADMPGCAIVLGPHGKIVYANEAACATMGIGDYVGQSFGAFFSENTRAENDDFYELVLDAVRDKDSRQQGRCPFYAPDGTRYLFFVTSSHLVHNGERYIVVTCADITAEEAAERLHRESIIVFLSSIVYICLFIFIYSVWNYLGQPFEPAGMTRILEVGGVLLGFYVFKATSLTIDDLGLGTRNLAHNLKIDGIACLGIIAFFSVLKLILMRAAPDIIVHPEAFYDPSWVTPYRFVSYIFTAIIQEFLTRGIMQESLLHVLTGKHVPAVAIIMSTLMFATLHLSYTPFFMLGAGLMLGVFGIIYMKQRSIWGLALIHFTFGMSAAMLGLI